MKGRIELQELEEKIKDEISKYSNSIGFYANDLKGNVIKQNETELFETASCIKLFILITYFKQIYEGKIKREDLLTYNESCYVDGSGVMKALDKGVILTSRNTAILMIVVSDNIATNMMIDYLGLEAINQTIQDLGFTHTKLFQRVDFEKYNKMGQTTPIEYARAFEQILKQELFDQKTCEEMLEILKKQQNNSMLIKGLSLKDIDEKGKGSPIQYIASKDGGLDGEYFSEKVDNVRNDGGIISTIYGEYIVTIFIKKFKDRYFYYNNEAINCGSQINKTIFNTFMELKGRFK